MTAQKCDWLAGDTPPKIIAYRELKAAVKPLKDIENTSFRFDLLAMWLDDNRAEVAKFLEVCNEQAD